MGKKRAEWWVSPVRLVGMYWNLKKEDLESAINDFINRGGKVVAYGAIGGPQQVAYYQSKIVQVDKSLGDYDPLEDLTKIAHRYGLKVRVYINVHWFDRNFYEAHKDWAQVKADGDPISDLYGEGWSMCVNSPWRNYSFEIIREIAENYDIDALFLDGPAIYGGCCYCKYCQDLFMKKYGVEIPQEPDWKNLDWKRFIEFRYESMERYMRDAYNLLKSIRTDTAIYLNFSGQTWPKYGSAVDPERLVHHEDIVGVECYQFYTRPVEVPIWFPSWTTKYAYSVSKGKPVCLFLAGSHLPWYLYPVTEAEVKLSIAQGIANGAIHTDVTDPGADIFRLVEDNPQLYVGSDSIADVALLWSRHTGDFYTADELSVEEAEAKGTLTKLAGDFHIDWSERIKGKGASKSEAERIYVEEVRGFFEVLLRSHILFDLIGDGNIENELSKYNVLVLPASACLSYKQAEAIKRFVKQGGGLIASYNTSLYDEIGRIKDNFILKDVLPADYLGLTLGPFRWDYMSIKNEHLITKGLGSLLPSTTFLLGVKAKPETEILGVMMAPLPHRYGKVERELRYPTLLAGMYGKGRVVYFPGNIGGQYWAHKFPGYKRLIINAIRWVAKRKLSLEAQAPQSVELTLFRNEDVLILHMVNMTYEFQRPVETVLPVDVKVKINIPHLEVKRSYLLTTKEELPIKISKENVEIAVENVREYEAAVIEL